MVTTRHELPIGKSLFEMVSVYMGIAEIAFDPLTRPPPLLCQTGTVRHCCLFLTLPKWAKKCTHHPVSPSDLPLKQEIAIWTWKKAPQSIQATPHPPPPNEQCPYTQTTFQKGASLNYMNQEEGCQNYLPHPENNEELTKKIQTKCLHPSNPFEKNPESLLVTRESSSCIFTTALRHIRPMKDK